MKTWRNLPSTCHGTNINPALKHSHIHLTVHGCMYIFDLLQYSMQETLDNWVAVSTIEYMRYVWCWLIVGYLEILITSSGSIECHLPLLSRSLWQQSRDENTLSLCQHDVKQGFVLIRICIYWSKLYWLLVKIFITSLDNMLHLGKHVVLVHDLLWIINGMT